MGPGFPPTEAGRRGSGGLLRLGSDGTVGARTRTAPRSSSTRPTTSCRATSSMTKKSGAMTASHLRFGPEPSLDLPGERRRLRRLPINSGASTASTSSRWQRDGRPPPQQPYGPLEVWDHYRPRCNARYRTSNSVLDGRSAGRSRRSPTRKPDQHGDATCCSSPSRVYCRRRGGCRR